MTFPIHMFEYTTIVLIVPSPNKMERRAGIRLSRNHESSRRDFVFSVRAQWSQPVPKNYKMYCTDVLHRCAAQLATPACHLDA